MSSPVMDNNSNSANPAILSPTENSATDNSTEFANCADEFVSCEEDNNNIPTTSSSSAEPVVPDQAGEEEEGQQKDCQIPTNHVHIGMVNPLTTMLDLTAGDFLELTTKTGKIIGELLQLNSKTGILLLREQKNGEKANLHFVNISNLKTFNKIASSALNYRPPRLPFNSYQAANDRLARAEHRKEKLWVNSELIDQTAMRTFVELKRIFEDVSWDSTKIIVLKCVSIGHPYDETAIRALDSNWSSENTAIRIKKILKRQMSPQSTTNSSTSMANASFDSGENNSIRSSSESKMASAIATLVTATAIDCTGVDGKS